MTGVQTCALPICFPVTIIGVIGSGIFVSSPSMSQPVINGIISNTDQNSFFIKVIILLWYIKKLYKCFYTLTTVQRYSFLMFRISIQIWNKINKYMQKKRLWNAQSCFLLILSCLFSYCTLRLIRMCERNPTIIIIPAEARYVFELELVKK